MNKTYKALAWLAGLALVFGLVFAIKWTAQTLGYFAGFPHLSTDDGIFTGLVTGVAGLDWPYVLKPAAFLLVSGATLLAIALAWADRRYGWLTALIVVTIVAQLWSWGVDAWGFMNTGPISPLDAPGPVPVSVEVAAFSSYAAPLIPVVMSLVLALSHRRLSPSATTSTDADLGIVRSPL